LKAVFKANLWQDLSEGAKTFGQFFIAICTAIRCLFTNSNIFYELLNYYCYTKIAIHLQVALMKEVAVQFSDETFVILCQIVYYDFRAGWLLKQS